MIRRFKLPHTLVLLYFMVLLAYGLTLVLPAGQFESQLNERGQQVVVPGTFELLPEREQLPLSAVLTVIPRGLESAQGIIFFVLIIGGALAVIRATGALDAGMAGLLARYGGRPALMILLGMLAFTIGSSTVGLAEEYIPLAVILIALCAGMRLDNMVAAGILVIGFSIGFGIASMNPFTVLIAQDIAGLAPVSGIGYRLLLFLPFFGLGYYHLWRYASKIRSDTSQSLVADLPGAQPDGVQAVGPITVRQRLVLIATLAALGIVVWGIKVHHWYFIELGGAFFALAVVCGLLCRMSLDAMAASFIDGAAALVGTALLIGFARAIEIMLSDGQVLHTIVHGLSQPLLWVGPELSAVGMLLIQSILNLFIPSGSGQAYVTMPIMTPIADLAGVGRQVAVLAYQMGDGFTNMIVPTNPILMSILGTCGVPYVRWLRFIWPLVLQLLVLGSVALVVAVLVGYH